LGEWASGSSDSLARVVPANGLQVWIRDRAHGQDLTTPVDTVRGHFGFKQRLGHRKKQSKK